MDVDNDDDEIDDVDVVVEVMVVGAPCVIVNADILDILHEPLIDIPRR